MLAQIDTLMTSKEDVKRSLHEKANELRKQAWDNAEIYKKYLLA
jgi:hypothetical protein